MLEQELIDLAKTIQSRKFESTRIELKKAKGGSPERLYDTLSSFSNQPGGGIILFGIDEHCNYEICGVSDPQAIQVAVNNQAKEMVPVLRPVMTVAAIDRKFIVSAEIAEIDVMEKPCYYGGAGRVRGSFIRVGDSDERMSEYEIYSYEAFKRRTEDELNAVERAEISDLDTDYVEPFMLRVKEMKPNVALQPEDKALKMLGMTNGIKPTVAGVLVLGTYPQQYFPQLSVTAMLIDGVEFAQHSENGARFIDNKRIEGTLSQMLAETMNFIRRNSRTATIIKADGTRADESEYPTKAIRELVLNALIHRDYSFHTMNSPIRVLMYKDRIVIENPGGLYGRITIDELGKRAADTRNPFIAGALELIEGNENRFSGIPTVMGEMEKAGLYPPVFESTRGVFRVTLYNEKTSVSASDTERNDVTDIDSKIINYCSKPRSREEIASHIGIASSYYVSMKYIRPLIEQGKLLMTLPDKPKSKKQRYVRS